MKKSVALMAALLSALFLLSACGGDEDETGGASGGAKFNAADVAFAQGMIPHHQQAIEMAALAADRAESAEVKKLAEGIEAAQGPEIDQLTGWLESWGKKVPSSSMDHGSMGGGMSGMMDSEDMAMLEESSGAAFDMMFVEMMIQHHEGAIEMARVEQARGKNPAAVALAKKVEADQEAEISRMKDLLGEK